MKVRKVEDRDGLRRKLVARAEEKARGLVRKGGGWDPHITLKTLQLCRKDGGWIRDYREYARQEGLKGKKNPTHGINCELGKKICRAVDGEAEKNAKGAILRPVRGEIVGKYTVLRHRRD